MGSPADHVCRLLRDSVIQICSSHLTFYSHLVIKANIEMLLDSNDSIAMVIDDVIKCESHLVPEPETLLVQSMKESFEDGGRCSGPIKQEAEPPPLQGLMCQVSEIQSAPWLSAPAIFPHSQDTLQSTFPSDTAPDTVTYSAKMPASSQVEQQVECRTGTEQDQIEDVEPVLKVGDSDIVTDHVTNQMTDSVIDHMTDTTNMEPADNISISPTTHRPANPLNPKTEMFDLEFEIGQLPSDESDGEEPVLDVNFSREEVELLTGTCQMTKQGSIYKCPDCEFQTEHGSAMKVHFKSHKKALSCDHCEEMFSSPTALKIHMAEEHHIFSHNRLTIGPFSCKNCEKDFESLEELRQHLLEEHGTEQLSCLLCDYTTTSSKKLQRHMKKHRTDDMIKCDMCDVGCASKRELKFHIEEYHKPEASAMCDICGVNMSGPLMLKDHIKTVHHRHNCDGCGYSTANVSSFTRHQAFCDKKKLICKICDDSSSVCITQLRKHLRQQHPVDRRKQNCEYCDKVFMSRQGLHTHRKVIHGHKMVDNKAFTCHSCGKSFPIFKYLKAHMKSHEAVKPYECPKCRRTFKYHRNFKTHKQGCINTAGYPCPICNKPLKNEYNLRVHINGIHVNERSKCA